MVECPNDGHYISTFNTVYITTLVSLPHSLDKIDLFNKHRCNF